MGWSIEISDNAQQKRPQQQISAFGRTQSLVEWSRETGLEQGDDHWTPQVGLDRRKSLDGTSAGKGLIPRHSTKPPFEELTAASPRCLVLF